MNVAQIIQNLGGPAEVMKLTGLTKGRISQWKTANSIPTPWEKYLRSVRPDAFPAIAAEMANPQKGAA